MSVVDKSGIFAESVDRYLPRPYETVPYDTEYHQLVAVAPPLAAVAVSEALKEANNTVRAEAIPRGEGEPDVYIEQGGVLVPVGFLRLTTRLRGARYKDAEMDGRAFAELERAREVIDGIAPPTMPNLNHLLRQSIGSFPHQLTGHEPIPAAATAV